LKSTTIVGEINRNSIRLRADKTKRKGGVEKKKGPSSWGVRSVEGVKGGGRELTRSGRGERSELKNS